MASKKNIIELFKSAQLTTSVHQKNSIVLKEIYESSDKENFFPLMLKPILNILLKTENETNYYKRSVDFFTLFCSILKQPVQPDTDDSLADVEHPLLTQILLYLLAASSNIDDTVRIRSCQIISKILDCLIEVDITGELCKQLEKHLLIRLEDPKNVVRQQAVNSLHHLQNPSNSEDKIITQFINLMNSDSFAKVRLICIEKVALRNDVLTSIIGRTRDVDVNVRLAAFKRLTPFAEYLKISEKRRILLNGFLDVDKVKDFLSTTLIKSWLEHYDNILSLMKSVRLDADEGDIKITVVLYEYILEVFFQQKSHGELSAVLMTSEKKLIPLENLDWELTCYWRIYVQFLSKDETLEEERDKVVPELVHFCSYIEEYCSHLRKNVTITEFLMQQFIIKQLFLITKTYKFDDVVNRKCLNALVRNILQKIILLTDVTEVIVSNLEYSIPDVEQRIQFVNEIISDIMYPLNNEKNKKKNQETQYQLSRIKVKINCLTEQQQVAVEQENFIEAERLKHSIEQENSTLSALENSAQAQEEMEKRTDIPTIIKYLDIAAGLLLSPQITYLTSSLQSLKQEVIQELLIHDDSNVILKAMRCFALCCIIDKTSALAGIHIFSKPIISYQSGEECSVQTILLCIQAVVDMLRIYGSQLMAAPENEACSASTDEKHQTIFAGGTSLTDVLQGITDLMDDEQYEIQEKATSGLCKLVLSDRIHSPSLISRLIIKWCNPTTDNDCEMSTIKHTIGETLEKLPLMQQNSDQLQDAVLITINTLGFAPKTSPLADVNKENIAKFMLALCKISPNGPQLHANLALKICNEIVKQPKNKMNLFLSKMLLMLDIPEDEIIIQNLLHTCDEIRNNIREQTIVNNIVKFISKLSFKNLNNDLVDDEE